jgi:hypothetical protein
LGDEARTDGTDIYCMDCVNGYCMFYCNDCLIVKDEQDLILYDENDDDVNYYCVDCCVVEESVDPADDEVE